MIKANLLREYRIKSYLNMNHYIVINGNEGQTHPHTWEFVFVILMSGDKFVEFRDFENAIDDFMDKFQNHVLNDIAPFDSVNPTLENVTDYFGDMLSDILAEKSGLLRSIEGSESPTRSYIVNYSKEPGFISDLEGMEEVQQDAAVDYIVSQMRKKRD